MAYFVLILLTLVSCIIFEYVRLSDIVRKLLASYREQFATMSDSSTPDELKQKKILALAGQQLWLLLKLVLGIGFFVAPFLSLYFLQALESSLSPNMLLTFWGMVIPFAVVILYMLLKRLYVNLFKHG